MDQDQVDQDQVDQDQVEKDYLVATFFTTKIIIFYAKNHCKIRVCMCTILNKIWHIVANHLHTQKLSQLNEFCLKYKK